MGIYPFVRWFARVTLSFYFRRIRIEGMEHVPKEGPLLIISNHQNALLDALLVGAFTPRSIYYLTRSDVFVGWVKRLLHAIHMLPVYRMRDGYSTLGQNTHVFNTCKDLFAHGEGILIFPEGNHGEHHFLRPLTKGAARLALQAVEQPENEGLQVLPVGLNFFAHRSPRSTVLIKYGNPFPVKPFSSSYKKNPAKGLIGLRRAMSESMKGTLVISEETADYKLRRDTIFREENESCSFDELKAVRCERASTIKRKPLRFWARVLNPVPYTFLNRVLKRVEDVVFHATVKYAFAVSVFPLWWVLVFALLSFAISVEVASLAVLLMIFGLFYSYQR